MVAILGRGAGLDVVSSHELGRDGLPDNEQLIRAAMEGRCVVTQNYVDFRPLSDEFQKHGLPHAGVLLVRRGAISRNHTGVFVAALVAHAAENPNGMPPYMVDYLRF